VATQKVVEPAGEVRDEFEVFGDLLRRCGLDKNWPWQKSKNSTTTSCERVDSPGRRWSKRAGVWDEVRYKNTRRPLSQGGGFKTPTGKVEIYSTYWHRLGYDPLPSSLNP